MIRFALISSEIKKNRGKSFNVSIWITLCKYIQGDIITMQFLFTGDFALKFNKKQDLESKYIDLLCPGPRSFLPMHLGKRDQNAKYFKFKKDVCEGTSKVPINASWQKYVFEVLQTLSAYDILVF